MKNFHYVIFLITLLFSLPSTLCAASMGADFSYALSAAEPANLHGYNLGLWYDPEKWRWRKFNIYLEADFSHWWVNSPTFYRVVNIVALAPIVRYTFNTFDRFYPMAPYIELSIGAAYLSSTHLGYRNLGEHFAFQDQVGLGVLLGQTKRLTVGIHALHYSNAALCSKNSGISVPLMLDIGYRFA